MTVTLYSMHHIRTQALVAKWLRPTVLNGAESKPMDEVTHAPMRSKPLMQDATDGAYHPVYDHPEHEGLRLSPEQWAKVDAVMAADPSPLPAPPLPCKPSPDSYGPREHQLLQDIDGMYSADLPEEPDIQPGVHGRLRVSQEVVDDWYSSDIEDDGFLEQLDRSAESVHFP